MWDESTMSHKWAIETLNRTFQNLRDSTDIIGEMVVLFSDDLQQNLQVIQRRITSHELIIKFFNIKLNK